MGQDEYNDEVFHVCGLCDQNLESPGIFGCTIFLFLSQMLPHDTRNKIKNITGGIILIGSNDHCKAIRNFLCAKFATNRMVKKEFESNAIPKEGQMEYLFRGGWVFKIRK